MIRFVPRLPQQAAFALYNYIIGYVMFYVRSSHEHSQQLVGSALSILWMVVHSVHGIMFKDLKQILRKEQCDASILLTANVPSAKKIIVHGPEDRDEGGIPSQFPVQEDTQFLQLWRESLDFFGIDEKEHASHFLIDYKTRKLFAYSAAAEVIGGWVNRLAKYISTCTKYDSLNYWKGSGGSGWEIGGRKFNFITFSLNFASWSVVIGFYAPHKNRLAGTVPKYHHIILTIVQ